MAQNRIQVNIETKADTRAVAQFQREFQRAFKTPISAQTAKQLMEFAERLKKIGIIGTVSAQSLKKALDLSGVIGKSTSALRTFVQSGTGKLGPQYKYARTEAELLRRAAQQTRVNELTNGLKSASNALKPIRVSLIKTDEGFRAIYVKTQLIKERLVAHRSEVARLSDKVRNLRREYDASAETAKTAAQVRRLGELKQKLDNAERELKRKVTLYEKDLTAAKKEQSALLTQTNAKLQGQKVQVSATLREEQKLSDTAKVFLNTARQQHAAAVQLTAEKKKQQQIDLARRESYALMIAGNQLKSYGDQFAVLGRQASEAFAEIDFQIRRAAAASGISFADDAMTMLRPTEKVNDQLAIMTETAKRAAEQLGFIPTAEVARGMYFFASTTGEGFNSVQELNRSMGQLTPIMQAAAITSTDLETSIKGVYGVINQYAMPMERASDVTQMLYFAAQKTAAEFPDFIESLKMLGPVAAQSGVSFEDTLKSLAVLADSGIRGTTAGRALRQMFLQLNDPADRATKVLDKAATKLKGTGTVFKDLVYDAKGNFLGMANYIKVMAQVTDQLTQRQKSQLLGMIATAAETPALTKLIEAESKAMKENKSIITDNTKEIGNAAAARAMFAESVDLVTQSTQASLGRIDVSIKNIKATFGAALAPALEKLSYALAGVSERFDNFAKENPQLVRLVTLLTGAAAAAAILSGALLAVIAVFKMIRGAALPTLAKGLQEGSNAAVILSKVLGTGLDEAAVGASKAAKNMSGIQKAASSVSGLFSGLKAKVAAPFASIAKGGGVASKIFATFGRILGPFATVFRVLGLKIQAIITAVVGFFTGFFQGMNRGKEGVDVFSGAMSALEPILGAIGSALDVISKAFGLVYEAARFAGIQIGKLFGEGGALKPVADLVGMLFSVLGGALDMLGGAIGGLTDGLKNLNDQAIGPHAKKLEELDGKIRSMEANRAYSSGVARDNIQKEIDKLKAEKQAVLDLIAAEAKRAPLLQQYSRGLTSAPGGGGRPPTAVNPNLDPDPKLFGTETGTGTKKQSAREKALELAQQAASLAEALYKIEGLNLKALIRRTMGQVAEAMKLAVKLAAPYAKAFSKKTLDKVGEFSNAVGAVASAVGGMVDAATKLAEYKSPKPAAIRKVIADMSIAMTAMVAEAKKFTGSQVAIVQLYSDSAQAVVGAIQAAVEAFNSMATGVYQPPANVLKQIARDISRAVQEFTKQLASAPTQPMLDKAKAFAEAADAVIGTIGNAVGAFKELRNYVKPLPSMLQAVVDTIEISIRQMLVSMGKFSLNEAQWNVVKTFAEVAKAISDAVGGTYDAFVKQMDFVDQFREEIDYNKVFGWIEAGIKKMADIAAAMPVGMIQMAKDAAEAAQAIAGALNAFFDLATSTGGEPALLADSLQVAVNSVLAIIEAFASTTQFVGASFVDSLIAGMQSRESALAAEAARLNAILGSAGGSSVTRSNNNTLTINHVVTDPNGVLKNASAQQVAQLLSGDVFISNLQHTIKTQ